MLSGKKKMKVLSEISQSSSKGPALYNVLKEITQRMAETLKAEIAVVFTYDEESGELVAQQPSPGLDYLSSSRFRFPVDSQGPLADSYRSAKPVLIERRLSKKEGIAPFAPDLSVFDLIACPLFARGRSIGLIVLANKLNRKGFNRSDLNLVELISPQIAVFLDNAMLYRRSEEKVAQLTSLIRVVDAINTAPSLDRLYDLALDVIRGLFAVEKTLLNVINQQTGVMETVRSFGFDEDRAAGHLGKPFESVEGCFVLKNDGAFLSPNIKEDDRCSNMAVDMDAGSVLCVPIRAGKNIYGILHMSSHYLNAFDEEDAILANAIGEQIGMAVESAQLFEEVSRLAITDGLTGLYNVRHLKRVLGEEVKRSLRYDRPLSFIMLDIDFFKIYNDNHGHLRGDEVLRTLASLLQQNTRDVDTVARYGGEEFSVIIPEVAKQEAFSMAERIRRVIQEHVFPYEEDQPEGNLTVSVGVANLPDDARDAEDLIDKADRALYRAKQAGRNLTCLYEPQHDTEALHPDGPSPLDGGKPHPHIVDMAARVDPQAGGPESKTG